MLGSSNSQIPQILPGFIRKIFDTNRDVAVDVERRLVYFVIWPTLVLIFAAQAFLATPDMRLWQFAFTFSSIAFLLISFYLLKWMKSSIAFGGVSVFLLASPILFQEKDVHPWMSYGLIIFLVTCQLADLQKWFISLPLIVFLAWLQQTVLRQNLNSITDVRDIKALHGYFSSAWVIGFGFCAYWVMHEYLKRAETLEGNIQGYQKEIYSKLRNIHKLNRRDYRNIQLHGTVLNTLNGALLNSELLKNPKQLAKMLSADIESLLVEPITEREVRRKYNEISANPRIQISSKIFPWTIQDRKITAQTLELIREIILNTDRHTDANRIHISLKQNGEDEVLLTIKENSLKDVTEHDFNKRISAAQSSRTLKRLIEGLGAKITIEARGDVPGLLYSIRIPFREETVNPAEILYRVRNSPVSFFTTGLARITIFYSALCIPGFVALHLDWRASTIIVASTLISFLSIFIKSCERLFVYLGTYLALISFLAGGLLFQGCDVGVYIPWFYNYVIGMVFLAAVIGKGSIARWIPAFIFSAQSLTFPKLFYKGCADLLNGSTPGLAVIIFSAIATLIWRRRYSEKLAVTTSGIYNDNEKLASIHEAIEIQAQWIINEIALFAQRIESKPISLVKLTSEIRRQVDLVRAFLLCSEHFESAFVRELFDFAKDRYEDGQTTRMQIYGDNFVHLQDEKSARAVFTKLYEGIETKNIEITLQGLDRVSMEVLLDAKTFKRYLKAPLRMPKTPGLFLSVERL